jgi:hypothetical protein
VTLAEVATKASLAPLAHEWRIFALPIPLRRQSPPVQGMGTPHYKVATKRQHGFRVPCHSNHAAKSGSISDKEVTGENYTSI